jgi:hypothetical protein
MSWITREDEVRAIVAALEDTRISGAVNATAPGAVTNAEFTAALAHALRRPAWLAVPPVVLELVLGHQMAHEVLLFSQRAGPSRLLASGFEFTHPELPGALAAILGS